MQASDAERSHGFEPPAPLPSAGTGFRLWLVRHAEVHPDWQGRAYGNLDVPLSPAGLERTEELARAMTALAPAIVVSSPLERAHRLARAIANGAGATLELDPRLAEIHRGSWQGRSVSELHERFSADVSAFYADPWGFREHGGENDAMVAARAGAVVTELVQGRPGCCAVLTTHYNVIRVLVSRAFDVEPARSFGIRIDPAHAVLLVDGPQGWELWHSNAFAPPLESPERARGGSPS